MGVGGGGQKMTPPFFGSKIMNLLVFSILSRKSFSRDPTLWGLYGAEWDERLCSLCTFQPFLLCSSTSVTPWYLL